MGNMSWYRIMFLYKIAQGGRQYDHMLRYITKGSMITTESWKEKNSMDFSLSQHRT